MYASILSDGDSLEHSLETGRHAWLQVARGWLKLNGKTLGQGDGAAINEETALQLEGGGAEVLLFDLS